MGLVETITPLASFHMNRVAQINVHTVLHVYYCLCAVWMGGEACALESLFGEKMTQERMKSGARAPPSKGEEPSEA